jgi:hypothetical protein
MAHSRRTWMKTAAMGLGGLLASERSLAVQPVNHACALADPRDEIKITGLEIILLQRKIERHPASIGNGP